MGGLTPDRAVSLNSELQAAAEGHYCSAVVVPTYNNAATLLCVLKQIEATGLPIIVVNDGSTDQTDDELDRWRSGWADDRHRILVHPANRGKAEALYTGFAAAEEAGLTHALTIDSDGQLDPAEIPALIEASREYPASLVIGVRDIEADDYPRKSRIGRVYANAAVKLESGQRVGDSQCGFRVYPLALLHHTRCGAGRYAFETEVLTRAVWAGAGIVEVPVTCTYLPEGGRVSHFRPGVDTMHGMLLHARLLLISLLPIPRAHPWHDPNGRDRKQRDPRPGWRRLLAWINPFAAWRNIKAGELRRDELAASLAIGVFIGNLPVFGLHTALCLYTAARLHLNPHLVIAGSAISTPPLGIVFVAAAVLVGHLVVRGRLISFTRIQAESVDKLSLLGQFMIEWTVGSLIVGSALSIAVLLGSYACFGALQRRLGVVEPSVDEDA